MYQISVCGRRSAIRRRKNSDVTVLDLTSKGPLPWIKFSPFYPISNIPVPGWAGLAGASVEGIWQGLKRFENDDHVDLSVLRNTSMRNLKRTSRARTLTGEPRGKVLGYQFGPAGHILLDYVSARRQIYLPAYRWVLDNCLTAELEELRAIASTGQVALLDYEQPRSH